MEKRVYFYFSLLDRVTHLDTHACVEPPSKAALDAPICGRCHDLLHHHRGVSTLHPTLQSIQDIFSESPYKHNHIYHILDAADFPLSLIPRLQQHLSIVPQRSQNRRSKVGKFYHDSKTEMSFIITRSDLLAPKKQQVDSMMPYLLQVLRDALGSSGRDIRLGNVRCVSSKRGWWTKELKEEIWKRGGGGWMVGKVNVGKSNLFENVFPKGRNEDTSFGNLRFAAAKNDKIDEDEMAPTWPHSTGSRHQAGSVSPLVGEREFEDPQKLFLLPPVPAERPYPVMPVVSSLPGTTASPIRLPFGGGKGELIDLPGLSRGNLEHYVREEHRLDLVMRQRIKAEQISVKPGQSLLIGGLIRIECTTPDVVLLACPFVPLPYHVTSTEKAVAVHTQQVSSGIATITSSDIGGKMASAGIFRLEWDVTKQRTGPLTSSAGVGLKTDILPFVVFSADILIEGCGWIELSVQVRKRALEAARASGTESTTDKSILPAVEVFSPEGKHIGIRRPMNAWALGGSRPLPVSRRTSRPRRSMRGVKKSLKLAKRKV